MAEQQRAETGRSSARRVTSTGLAELLELSPDVLVVVDQSGTIVQANAQVATLFGYSREEALGQPLEALLPERLRATHAVHRQHYFTAPSARAMGTHLQLFGRRKDGSEFPLDISLRPVLLDEDEDLLAVGAVRDMSEQRRAERERDEQAELIRTQAELIQLTHDALFTRDLGSRVIFWNKGPRRSMATAHSRHGATSVTACSRPASPSLSPRSRSTWNTTDCGRASSCRPAGMGAS